MATKTTKKTGEARAYLLKGDDDFQKQQHLDKLLASLVSGDFADFDLEHMEGDSTSCERIMAGLGVAPFGSTRRVVLVKYANKIHPDEQEKLAVQVLKTPASACLVLVNPAADKVDGRPKKGSEVIGDLSKAVRKIGEVIEFGGGTNKEKQTKAREFAQSLFAQAKKKLDARAMSLFLERAGADFTVISSEGQKLIDYSGDNPSISAQDVMAVTSETPEEKVFKLVDAIAARNQAAALRLMDELFETGDDPKADAPKTLSNISRQFRFIWQAKILMEAGVNMSLGYGGRFQKESVPASVQAMLPSDTNLLDELVKKGWQGEKIARQARPLSRADLIRCFNAISKTDMTLKGMGDDMDDPRLAMDLLVIELAKANR